MGNWRFQRESLRKSFVLCAWPFSSCMITLHFLPHQMKVIILAKEIEVGFCLWMVQRSYISWIIRELLSSRGRPGGLWPLMQGRQPLAASPSTGYILVKCSVVVTSEFCSGVQSIPKASQRSPQVLAVNLTEPRVTWEMGLLGDCCEYISWGGLTHTPWVALCSYWDPGLNK